MQLAASSCYPRLPAHTHARTHADRQASWAPARHGAASTLSITLRRRLRTTCTAGSGSSAASNAQHTPGRSRRARSSRAGSRGCLLKPCCTSKAASRQTTTQWCVPRQAQAFGLGYRLGHCRMHACVHADMTFRRCTCAAALQLHATLARMTCHAVLTLSLQRWPWRRIAAAAPAFSLQMLHLRSPIASANFARVESSTCCSCCVVAWAACATPPAPPRQPPHRVAFPRWARIGMQSGQSEVCR